MIEGRMAGELAAEYLGYTTEKEETESLEGLDKALDGLRQGMFAPRNRGKTITETEEGIPISTTLLKKGYVTDEEITRFPGVTEKEEIHPVIECTQNIPCNPCQDVCPNNCIKVDYWDIHAMADAIYSICHNESLFHYLQTEGKNEVDQITWEKVGAWIRELYERTLNGNN